jgi:hypothetical protein
MKIISLVLFMLFAYSKSFACDICGGASNSLSLGFLPNNNVHFIGFRSSFKNFESKDLHTQRFKSKESFISNELYGKYKISNKFQAFAFVPYAFNILKDSIKMNKLMVLEM